MQQLQLILTGVTIEELVAIAADFVAKNSSEKVEKPARKVKAKAAPVEQQAELPLEESLQEQITEAKEQITEAKEQITEAKEQIAEAPASTVPQNATDLMAAVMPLVAGDSAKKIKLVKLLEEYKAKTINTLAQEHYADFWAKVKEL